MRVSKKDYDQIVEEMQNEWGKWPVGVVEAICKGFVAGLGIEIVPDPEPELPPRPWSVFDNEGVKPNIGLLDDRHRTIFWLAGIDIGVDRSPRPFQKAALQALVSAYNAAGKRKRIEVRHAENAKPRIPALRVFEINGEEIESLGRGDAIGSYIWRHASDLGLEIVES